MFVTRVFTVLLIVVSGLRYNKLFYIFVSRPLVVTLTKIVTTFILRYVIKFLTCYKQD